MITDQRLGPYVVEIDENGDEVLSLEGPWALPANYHTREVELAVENIDNGHHRSDLAISRGVLFDAVQTYRAGFLLPPWGLTFFKDPRKFSSVKKERE